MNFKNKIKVAPSILSADYADLKNEIEKVKVAGADMLHVDVMDGLFVPNMSFGVPLIQSIKKHAPNMLMDVHLMIDRPHRYIKDFAKDEIISLFVGILAEVKERNQTFEMMGEIPFEDS